MIYVMRKYFGAAFLSLVSVIGAVGTVKAQIKISGQTCVLPGTIYQYVITGADSSSTQLCVTAGTVFDSVSGWIACKTSGFTSNSVLVMWNDSAFDDGTLNLSSSSGNTSLNAHFAPSLQPGAIDSASKTQIITIHQVPATILCGPDSGGSCSPSYSHQWQQSVDMINWSDIPSATGASVSIDTVLTQTIYYRRKVQEGSSGSIGYSDVAAVFVIVDSAYSSTSLLNSRLFILKQRATISEGKLTRMSLTAE
jgi:hypothetical protein